MARASRNNWRGSVRTFKTCTTESPRARQCASGLRELSTDLQSGGRSSVRRRVLADESREGH